MLTRTILPLSRMNHYAASLWIEVRSKTAWGWPRVGVQVLAVSEFGIFGPFVPRFFFCLHRFRVHNVHTPAAGMIQRLPHSGTQTVVDSGNSMAAPKLLDFLSSFRPDGLRFLLRLVYVPPPTGVLTLLSLCHTCGLYTRAAYTEHFGVDSMRLLVALHPGRL